MFTDIEIPGAIAPVIGSGRRPPSSARVAGCIGCAVSTAVICLGGRWDFICSPYGWSRLWPRVSQSAAKQKARRGAGPPRLGLACFPVDGDDPHLLMEKVSDAMEEHPRPGPDDWLR